jgi:hypothetical protein
MAAVIEELVPLQPIEKKYGHLRASNVCSHVTGYMVPSEAFIQ